MRLRRRRCFLAAVLFACSAAQGLPTRAQPGPLEWISPQAQKAKQAPPAPKLEEHKKRKRLIINLAGFELLDSSKARKEVTMVGATRGLAEHPIALAPRLGNFYGAGACFIWSYTGKTDAFVLTFRDDEDNEVLRTKVSGMLYCPADQSGRFEPGKTYFWTVDISPPRLGASPSEPAAFIVVSQNRREEIEKALTAIQGKDPYEAGLARAKLFTDHRLWYDAIGAFTGLIGCYPDRAELYEQRGMIYAQLEATKKLAEQDFARADALKSPE